MNNNRDPYNTTPGQPHAQNVNPVYSLTNTNTQGGGQQDGGYETVTPDAVWDQIPGKKQGLPGRGPGQKFGIIGVVSGFFSISMSALALIFTWLFLVGFVLNIVSFVLAAMGIVFGSIGGSMNKRRGLAMGAPCIAAIVISAAALLVSGVIFTCTGCAASFFCSGDPSRLLW